MKVTQWFSGIFKPAHKGWYQRDFEGEGLYWYFDGSKWRFGGWYSLSNVFVFDVYSSNQDLPWRGLAEKP